jgi:hypothetical protein
VGRVSWRTVGSADRHHGNGLKTDAVGRVDLLWVNDAWFYTHLPTIWSSGSLPDQLLEDVAKRVVMLQAGTETFGLEGCPDGQLEHTRRVSAPDLEGFSQAV